MPSHSVYFGPILECHIFCLFVVEELNEKLEELRREQELKEQSDVVAGASSVQEKDFESRLTEVVRT